jgi:hypothetical protein
VCPPVLSSIPDRVPEMVEIWTFGVYSGLHAKGGFKIGLYWSAPSLIKFIIGIILEVHYRYIRCSLCFATERRRTGGSFGLRGAVVRDHTNREFSKQECLLPRTLIPSRCKKLVANNWVHVVIARQWVLSSFPAANLVHSIDKWISQWEVCSKFKV